ncbi:hypothetical protein DSLASN_17890 [Desulfoluna limicola]|uniref:Uncharacterized protein n=1 Tax=Desulfoluna limicola TaxID=2810562 RepID=A0ABN6F4D2_9BACT|nr:hypothetical protein [Desulfoluna limicola]BCS96157.1 hypothetical protein DSLASN_17890 [Desulfoluna limicola]
MKSMTTKMTQCLMIAGFLTLFSTPGFAGLTSLSEQELKGITGQSGIRTLVDDSWTDAQRREEDKNNSQIQALMALNGVVPHELIRDMQNVRTTINDSTRMVREFNTIQRDLLAVPTAVTTIISIPMSLGGIGGFF